MKESPEELQRQLDTALQTLSSVKAKMEECAVRVVDATVEAIPVWIEGRTMELVRLLGDSINSLDKDTLKATKSEIESLKNSVPLEYKELAPNLKFMHRRTDLPDVYTEQAKDIVTTSLRPLLKPVGVALRRAGLVPQSTVEWDSDGTYRIGIVLGAGVDKACYSYDILKYDYQNAYRAVTGLQKRLNESKGEQAWSSL